MKKTTLAILVSSLLLTACGETETETDAVGSQPDQSNPPIETPIEATILPPDVSFSLIKNIQERESLALVGTNNNATEGSESTYNWTIDLGSYTGEEISFTSNNANATLIVGDVVEDVSATITLSITNSNNEVDQVSHTTTINEVDAALLPPIPQNPEIGLAGTDTDNDGIRDDLEIAIYKLYPLSNDNREVLLNTVLAYQLALTTGDSLDDLDNDSASEELMKLAWCFSEHTELSSNEAQGIIKALLIDTPERLAAWEKYLVSRNGTVQNVIETTYDECRYSQN